MDYKFTIDWHNPEKTILIITLVSYQWDWHDFIWAVNEQVRMAKTVDHRVHAIFDFSISQNFPSRGIITQLPQLLNTKAGNEDLIVVVKANRVFEQFIRIVMRAFSLQDSLSRFRFVQTIQGALQAIEIHQTMTLN